MKKEKYWSQFANDFEERNNYVVGIDDMAIVLKKTSELRNLKKTLELGCGNGTYSIVLAKNSDILIATDFSDQMVNISKERLKSIKNIKVEKANCFNLQYPLNSFDNLFMANLLHIIPNPEKAITESHKVLKENGKIIVLDFGKEGMTFINKLRLFYRYFKTYGKPNKNNQNLTTHGIKKMLISCGFEIEEEYLIGNKMKAAFVIGKKRKHNKVYDVHGR